MPCNDVHADKAPESLSYKIHDSCKHESTPSSHNSDLDNCNPFCVCQCCSIKTEQPAILYQYIPVRFQLHLMPLKALPLGFIYLEILLQPPRIS
jgi:hypothetical protein